MTKNEIGAVKNNFCKSWACSKGRILISGEVQFIRNDWIFLHKVFSGYPTRVLPLCVEIELFSSKLFTKKTVIAKWSSMRASCVTKDAIITTAIKIKTLFIHTGQTAMMLRGF